MRLSDLAKRIPGSRIVGDDDVEVKMPRYDSRRVESGDLFCAVRGAVSDGNRFAEQAVKSGAVAVLTEDGSLQANVPLLIVPDDRQAVALAAHALYGDPTERIRMIGVTGTNGKTTITHILQSVLKAAGRRVGRIGTVGWEFEGRSEPLARTTPEAPDLLAMIAEMEKAGATDVVMEVTSIALPLKRVEGFRWVAGLFTNLTQDHLDLHGSMENYFAAKKLFFESIPEGSPAVSNVDDEYGLKMVEGIKAKTVSYAFDRDADVRGTIKRADREGLVIGVVYGKAEFEVTAPFVGTFNAENVLGTVATALAMGLDAEIVQKGVAESPQIRGRMERLTLEGGVTAVVDYAHTPDALSRALQALRPMTEGKLIVVVGAGGNRDKTKRPIMGATAETYSDLLIITSDNPRSEDPAMIVKEVSAGTTSGQVMTIVDRRRAIERALEVALEGDIILIAGKGHETYQEINGIQHHFDDREEVLNLRAEVAC